MGRRQFYAWVDQADRETSGVAANPDSWEAAEHDEWWANARQKRAAAMR